MFRYDDAEAAAQEALRQDPRFIKARYRRGLARKGNLELARAAVGMCWPSKSTFPVVMWHGVTDAY